MLLTEDEVTNTMVINVQAKVTKVKALNQGEVTKAIVRTQADVTKDTLLSEQAEVIKLWC